MAAPEPQEQRSGPSDRLVAVLAIEGTALLIALVTPVTPSKTGSTWSPADFFFADPSYLQEVLASFVVVNLMIGALGLVAWIAVRRDRSE